MGVLTPFTGETGVAVASVAFSTRTFSVLILGSGVLVGAAAGVGAGDGGGGGTDCVVDGCTTVRLETGGDEIVSRPSFARADRCSRRPTSD
jgi:hypothetical protein